MLQEPFYNPNLSYEENFKKGPFGFFGDGKQYPAATEPAHDFLGSSVHLPFGIPAGPLINGAYVKAALDHGFDIPAYKTVRTRKYPCHPWPNVLAVRVNGDLTPEKTKKPLLADREYREPISITNSFGVPSFDPDFWQPDLAEAVRHAKKGQVVVGSFQGTQQGSVDSYIADFTLAARLVREAGTKILEVNLSCPNEGTAHLLCFDVSRAKAVVEAIKNEIGNTPLIVKVAHFSEDELLRNFVREVGGFVQAISAINTIPAEIRNEAGEQALPGEGRLRSGVCGAAIKWAGLDMVRRLRKLREEFGFAFSIVGVGGVTAPEDYAEYRAAGADAVMSATGAMWHPDIALQIKEQSNLQKS